MNGGAFSDVLDEWTLRHGVVVRGAVDLTALSRCGFSDFVRARLSPVADALGFDAASLSARSAPWELFPWAKSVVVAAIPFSALPAPGRFPPPSPSVVSPSGKVAGYASRVDYHRHGRAAMDSLGVLLNSVAVGSVRFESAVDSAGVAERALALAAGIARLEGGSGSLALVEGGGAGCFLAELFLDIAPSALDARDAFEFDAAELSRSDRVVAGGKCPYGAVSADGELDVTRCVSYFTTMRRGYLDRVERRLVGDWLFGCDRCSVAVPGTDLPPAVEVDLEWLLFASASDVRGSVAETPMDHAGATMLRRNALAVLENIGGDAALELVSRFARTTGSGFLRDMATEVAENIR